MSRIIPYFIEAPQSQQKLDYPPSRNGLVNCATPCTTGSRRASGCGSPDTSPERGPLRAASPSLRDLPYESFAFFGAFSAAAVVTAPTPRQQASLSLPCLTETSGCVRCLSYAYDASASSRASVGSPRPRLPKSSFARLVVPPSRLPAGST